MQDPERLSEAKNYFKKTGELRRQSKHRQEYIEVLGNLMKQFGNKYESNMGKIYIALVDGNFLRDEQFVSIPLVYESNEKVRVVPRSEQKNTEGQRTSTTKFRKIGLFYHPKYEEYKTLLEVQLFTGRKHQIRVVTSQFLKYPLTGDYLYSPHSFQGPRPMLHKGIGFFIFIGF